MLSCLCLYILICIIYYQIRLWYLTIWFNMIRARWLTFVWGKIITVAIEDAAKIEKEAAVVLVATAHGVVALLLTRRCGVITRDQDLAPDLAHTTSVYVCVSHDNISTGLYWHLLLTMFHYCWFKFYSMRYFSSNSNRFCKKIQIDFFTLFKIIIYSINCI